MTVKVESSPTYVGTQLGLAVSGGTPKALAMLRATLAWLDNHG